MSLEFQKLLREEFEQRTKKNSRFSLRSFARLLNLAPSTVHQYLSGRYSPSVKNLKQICSRLNWDENTRIKLVKSFEEMTKSHADNVEIFNYDQAMQNLGVAVLRIKESASTGKAKANPDWWLKHLSLPPESRPEVEEAIHFLIKHGMVKVQGDKLVAIKRIKLVSNKVGNNSFLELQKDWLQGFDRALTDVPKDQRLVLMANVSVAAKHLPAIAKDMNRLLNTLRKKYDAGTVGKTYRFICGFIPAPEKDDF